MASSMWAGRTSVTVKCGECHVGKILGTVESASAWLDSHTCKMWPKYGQDWR